MAKKCSTDSFRKEILFIKSILQFQISNLKCLKLLKLRQISDQKTVSIAKKTKFAGQELLSGFGFGNIFPTQNLDRLQIKTPSHFQNSQTLPTQIFSLSSTQCSPSNSFRFPCTCNFKRYCYNFNSFFNTICNSQTFS